MTRTSSHTSFVVCLCRCQPVDESGVPQKDRWIATVSLSPIRITKKQPSISLFWYVAVAQQGPDSFNMLQGHQDKREDVKLELDAGGGYNNKFTLTAHLPDESSHPSHKWWVPTRTEQYKHFSQPRWTGVSVADSWNAKYYVRNITIQSADVQYQEMQRPGDTTDDVWNRAKITKFYGVLLDGQEYMSSLMIFQHIVTLPYTLTFSMAPSDKAHTLQSSDVHRLVDGLGERVSRFQQRFDRVFPLTSEYATPSHKRFAQAALSNLLGGIGYFHGQSLIEHSTVSTVTGANGKPKKERTTETKKTAPLSLLATVPSRSFFPRGFLWDEGFHQLLVSRFDVRLSVEILRSWVGLILPNGWLPREQILGEEARRRVPAQFQVQRPTIANPPVLLLAMGRMVTRLEDRLRARAVGVKLEVSSDGSVNGQPPSGGDDTLDDDVALLSEFLASAYPMLQKHTDWYFHTQSSLPSPKGERANTSTSLSSPSTFRWAGRTSDHCLASGFDDYPRAPFLPKPSDAFVKREGEEQQSALREGEGVEGHVDLHSWMIALTNTMSHIASFLSRHDAGGEQRWGEVRDSYRAKSVQLLSRLDELHWNNDKQMYCDLRVPSRPSPPHLPRRLRQLPTLRARPGAAVVRAAAVRIVAHAVERCVDGVGVAESVVGGLQVRYGRELLAWSGVGQHQLPRHRRTRPLRAHRSTVRLAAVLRLFTVRRQQRPSTAVGRRVLASDGSLQPDTMAGRADHQPGRTATVSDVRRVAIECGGQHTSTVRDEGILV